MKSGETQSNSKKTSRRCPLDGKLAAYLAATGGCGAVLASEADAAIVGNTMEQPFGINEEVNIDFNGDGQVDFQIDHDRYNLNGTDLDFLQVDKNDNNGASAGEDIFNINFASGTFPTNGTDANATADSGYVTDAPGDALGYYPLPLSAGETIGPSRFFDFQEGDSFQSGEIPADVYIRVNRLIDEDAGQIDDDAGLPTQAFSTAAGLPDTPHWTGLAGETKYVGVKMNLNDAGITNYGWIGVRIDNEDDATGAVTGWAYQTASGIGIQAGQTIPEPTSGIMAIVAGMTLVLGFCGRRLFGGKR